MSVTLSWSGLKKRLTSSVLERRLLTEPGLAIIPLARQAQLLGLHRSGLYYRPPVNEARVSLDKLHMNAIDEVYTDYPFYGSRRVRLELHDRFGIDICRERVQHLMRRLGIQAIYPKPKLSAANPEHAAYPYLLRGVAAARPNHIWGTDITYIRTEMGYVYLTAFIDWFSRYILSWQLSDSLELAFVLEALDEALKLATPEISNTDQGSHYTAKEFLERLQTRDVQISMDGRGRALDNIFTERLWRTIKYENVFLKSYRNLSEAQTGLSEYIMFYNERRRHSSIDNQTPAAVYFA